MFRYLLSAVIFALVAVGCSTSSSPADSTGAPSSSTTQAPPITSLPVETTTTSSTTTTTLPPQPPSLRVVPARGATVATYDTSIEVTTEPGVILTIDEAVLPVDAAGAASIEVLSSPGTNTMTIVGTNEFGLVSTMVVDYEFEPTAGWAMAIGDSVMLGTKPEIEKRVPGVSVDATVSRQFSAAPAMVQALVNGSTPPELIIIGLGSNGPARESDFDAVMEAAADVPLVAFINVRVPRQWEDTSNRVIAEGVARYDNAVLVDWYSVSTDHDELFSGDGVHPKQAGRVILAELIAEAVFPLGPPPLPVEDE